MTVSHTRRGLAAAASLAGLAALAGCASDAEADTVPPPTATPAAPGEERYADGRYTADGDYIDGGGVAETVTVTLTVAGDVVTAVEVTPDGDASPQSRDYQDRFIGGVADQVVGRALDDVSVDRVAGSSLTSGGFMAALDEIRAQALR